MNLAAEAKDLQCLAKQGTSFVPFACTSLVSLGLFNVSLVFFSVFNKCPVHSDGSFEVKQAISPAPGVYLCLIFFAASYFLCAPLLLSVLFFLLL